MVLIKLHDLGRSLVQIGNMHRFSKSGGTKMAQELLDDQELEQKSDYECSHAACTCIAKVSGYCSPQCEEAELKDGIEQICHCGHNECGREFFAGESIRIPV
jgi:hypothetical protein